MRMNEVVDERGERVFGRVAALSLSVVSMAGCGKRNSRRHLAVWSFPTLLETAVGALLVFGWPNGLAYGAALTAARARIYPIVASGPHAAIGKSEYGPG